MDVLKSNLFPLLGNRQQGCSNNINLLQKLQLKFIQRFRSLWSEMRVGMRFIATAERTHTIQTSKHTSD